MRHESCPLWPWLIFDVSQMKMRLVSLVLAFVITVTLNGASEAGYIERQFRADLRSIIRADSPSDKVPDDAIAKSVEEAVADVKVQHPSFLVDSPKQESPTDEALQRDYEEMSRVTGGPARTKIWMFYFERWQTKRLTSDQRVILGRLFKLLIHGAEQKKQENGDSRKKG